MTQEELNEVVRLHKLWLSRKGGKMAILIGSNLCGRDLCGSDLRRSTLRNCDLSDCNICGSDLRGIDLSLSNLKGCNLKGSDLRGCNLRGSDLRGCNLKGCNLRGSDLSGSDLRGCNLNGSDLSNCDLDYSCLPLWCGSLTAHFDDRQLKQIAYHLVKAALHSKNASAETKRILSNPDLVEFANWFHRVDECGRIECENTV